MLAHFPPPRKKMKPRPLFGSIRSTFCRKTALPKRMRAFLHKTALKSELAFLPQKTAFPSPPPLPRTEKSDLLRSAA